MNIKNIYSVDLITEELYFLVKEYSLEFLEDDSFIIKDNLEAELIFIDESGNFIFTGTSDVVIVNKIKKSITVTLTIPCDMIIDHIISQVAGEKNISRFYDKDAVRASLFFECGELSKENKEKIFSFNFTPEDKPK